MDRAARRAVIMHIREMQNDEAVPLGREVGDRQGDLGEIDAVDAIERQPGQELAVTVADGPGAEFRPEVDGMRGFGEKYGGRLAEEAVGGDYREQAGTN